jgi:glycosyltransferase involved in cell wall biosynthesis
LYRFKKIEATLAIDSSRMHTLLIHQAFAAASDPGGTRHLELARYVVEAGDNVTIVASDVTFATGERVTPRPRLVTEEYVDGVRILRSFTPAWVRRSYLLRVFAFLVFMNTATINGLRAGPVDLVMGTSPPIFQALSAWLVAVVRRKPFLLEIRDLWPEFAIDIGVLKNPVLIALSRRLEAFLYNQATHLLVNSPAYRTYLIDKGVPSEKISLVANGVEADAFYPDSDGESVRREFLLDGKFVVTYAGAFGMANDLDTLVRAADRLGSRPDIHILLVGDGKERERLQTEVSKRNLSNITFTGPRPKWEIPNVLAASDACVAILKNIPMFRTTYPNKVFDYMAAGRPTVLAIDGVIRDVIEASHGGIFSPPGDDSALADAICQLADDPSRARQMGAAAREYVVRNFNRRDQAMSFLHLLRSIADVPVEVAAAD